MIIFVQNEFRGLHRWKDAPDVVGFLRHPHRHIFRIKTYVDVTHNDREIEFFMLQAEIDKIIASWSTDYPESERVNWSCEQMAEKVLAELSKIYPGRNMTCEVSEDGECGAIVGCAINV